MSMKTLPSVGRIVHYVPENVQEGGLACRAAIITETGFNTAALDTHPVSLWVFGKRTMVAYDGLEYDAQCKPHSWHWPEIAPEAPPSLGPKSSL